MTIQAIAMTSAGQEIGNASLIRKAYTAYTAKNASLSANFSSTASISQEARDRLAAESASGAAAPSNESYRLIDKGYTLAQLMEQKGIPLITVSMTDAQLSEIKLREQQDALREQINAEYAQAHAYQPVGQVIANDKLVATVFEGGGFELPQNIPGLSSESLSPEQRLAEIARRSHGQVISSGFRPTMGGIFGPGAPEYMQPPITARSYREIFEQEIQPVFEQKIQAWEAQTGKTYPRAA